ncbi:MAG: hypothetical protein HOG49_28460 [Candidatus Scalindua sp.]|jgi:hypothetical protein|nr:hypothetical protein [Candidatus Scalindua sp.]
MNEQIEYNICDTCGAKDGRAGNLWGTEGGPSECECCSKTRKTGEVCLFSYLPRTTEEVEKIIGILK